jgi:hypothetical protein
MTRNLFGSIAVFFGFVLLLGGCTSTTKIPWDFDLLDTSPSILEGEWLEEWKIGSIFQFKGNRFRKISISTGGFRVPFFVCWFRILDGHVELLTTALNENFEAVLSQESQPVEWSYVSRREYDIPDYIYSFDLQDDTLILKLIGGGWAKENDIGKTIKFRRAVNN